MMGMMIRIYTVLLRVWGTQNRSFLFFYPYNLSRYSPVANCPFVSVAPVQTTLEEYYIWKNDKSIILKSPWEKR